MGAKKTKSNLWEQCIGSSPGSQNSISQNFFLCLFWLDIDHQGLLTWVLGGKKRHRSHIIFCYRGREAGLSCMVVNEQPQLSPCGMGVAHSSSSLLSSVSCSRPLIPGTATSWWKFWENSRWHIFQFIFSNFQPTLVLFSWESHLSFWTQHKIRNHNFIETEETISSIA